MRVVSGQIEKEREKERGWGRERERERDAEPWVGTGSPMIHAAILRVESSRPGPWRSTRDLGPQAARVLNHLLSGSGSSSCPAPSRTIWPPVCSLYASSTTASTGGSRIAGGEEPLAFSIAGRDPWLIAYLPAFLPLKPGPQGGTALGPGFNTAPLRCCAANVTHSLVPYSWNAKLANVANAFIEGVCNLIIQVLM